MRREHHRGAERSRQEDDDAENGGLKRGDDPRHDTCYAEEPVVRGPVNGEQDKQVQCTQGGHLEAEHAQDAGLRALGPERLGPAAGDELRRPEGDDDDAEHDDGHGGRGLPALEHHVQEHVDEWTSLATASAADTVNTTAAGGLGVP